MQIIDAIGAQSPREKGRRRMDRNQNIGENYQAEISQNSKGSGTPKQSRRLIKQSSQKVNCLSENWGQKYRHHLFKCENMSYISKIKER